MFCQPWYIQKSYSWCSIHQVIGKLRNNFFPRNTRCHGYRHIRRSRFYNRFALLWTAILLQSPIVSWVYIYWGGGKVSRLYDKLSQFLQLVNSLMITIIFTWRKNVNFYMVENYQKIKWAIQQEEKNRF